MLIEDNKWIERTFGHGAQARTRRLQLFARIPEEDARAETHWSRTNGTKGTINAKPQYRGGRLRGIVLEVESVEDANKLCDNGVVANGKVHKTEPFCGDGRPTLCFRCGQYGHKARFCPAEKERCLRCGRTNHAKNECPRAEEDTFCMACKKTGHTVYQIRECPVGQKQWRIAKLLWRDRPRRFHQNPYITPPPLSLYRSPEPAPPAIPPPAG